MLRVLMADDNPRVYEVVRPLLEPHFKVVGSVRDGRALIEAAAELLPDIIITDLAMPVLNGLEAAREVKNAGSTALIIVLTVNTEPEVIAACLAAGAAAHVSKHRMFHELVPAVYEAIAANHHVGPG